MRMVNTDSREVAPWGSAADQIATFDGDVTVPFHSIRRALKYALIRWHQTRSPVRVVQGLQEEATRFAQVYSCAQPLTGLVDDFEMALAMSVALTNETDIAQGLKSIFSFEPCANGYAYYVGFKQAVLGLMLEDGELQRQARQHLAKFHATKIFYFPSTAVIMAALDGDLKKLKTSVKAISKKFDGYAQKRQAVSGDVIDIARLDLHWFSPYPDWAFFAQAIRRFGRVESEDTFWMPMAFLNSYAQEWSTQS